MAHGAPDHTRLSDDAYSHYILHYKRDIIWPITALETDYFNTDLVGVFGYFAICLDDSRVQCRMFVDNNHIGTFRVGTFKDYFGTGLNQSKPFVSIPVYNAIDGRYTMIVDYRWDVYIHKNLRIALTSTGGGVHGVHDIRLLYKQHI